MDGCPNFKNLHISQELWRMLNLSTAEEEEKLRKIRILGKADGQIFLNLGKLLEKFGTNTRK